jgi:hypothetical protein
VLAGHLRLNPRSRVYAIDKGDMGWKDWTPATEILAARFDQTIAMFAGLGGKDIDPRRLWPRPGTPAAAAAASDVDPELVAPTIAEFSVGGFMKSIYGQ